MTLRNSKYADRLLDKMLEKHLRAFGAVEIIGAMWCGKTWMAEAHAETKINLSNTGIRSLIEADHSLAFEGGKPHVIDEWQEIPSLWDATRLAVDAVAGEREIYASCMDSALPEPVRYYRDSDNLEVDAIIELRDGRWAGIEIKLSENKVAEGISNLLRLRNKIASNPLAQNPEPAFLAVLVGKTEFCRKTPEGVYVIPCTSLTA